MKKKYVALMAGVGAAMAIGAPMAMAEPSVPEVPSVPALPALPIPGAEPNGADCSFTAGTASASGGTDITAKGGRNEGNEGNCQSFGNDQHNGEYSNGNYEFPPTGGSENSNGGLSGGTFEGGDAGSVVPNQ